MPNRKSTKPTSSKVQRVRCKSTFYHISTASAAQKLLVLDAAGMSGKSGIITNYMDMFRFYKLEMVKVGIYNGDALNDSSLYPAVLAHVQPGATTDPVGFESVETVFQAPVLLQTTQNQEKNTLRCTKENLSQLGNWMVTSNDTGEELLNSYGELWLLNGTGFALTAGLYLMVQVEFDICFKDILDPSQLSIMTKQDKADLEKFRNLKLNIEDKTQK